ncbi:MAG: electron transfer flavoprotein subunit alpha/FixB family protein [Kiritimatiellae bacterium]|jgi:electron transfer flavoprotein alpha subunit|nr:electron transfer flavoprotein subunit alpha/FixB family protein [Kiritimatiellia bacterium]
MAKIIIHQDRVKDVEAVRALCPFNAIDYVNGYLQINAACKMCQICIKKDVDGIFEYVEDVKVEVDKDSWNGIAVYADHLDGDIFPVTFELIGKARELAAKINKPVYALMLGDNIEEKAEKLLHYGVDEVFVYDEKALKHFRIEPYAAAFEDFINHVRPSTVLIGGTNVGRSLAPRVAARFRSGLTADCTVLDMQDNTDLDQIRPAFGGNIMAHINTPNHRPQFATVRYKIFSAPERVDELNGKITKMAIDQDKLKSKITVLEVKSKPKEEGIEEAEVIVVAGRGLKKAEDMAMIERLAELLHAQLAGTRSLIEAGWLDPKRQIGLSGRTVKPKLIITCAVSGAIQFVAGMNTAEHIVAINMDKNAPIFKAAHVGIVGDIYEIIPALIKKITAAKECVA